MLSSETRHVSVAKSSLPVLTRRARLASARSVREPTVFQFDVLPGSAIDVFAERLGAFLCAGQDIEAIPWPASCMSY
jgi:hypothetical protein